jgi:hypothetical protein
MDRTACTELQCLYKGALYFTRHLNTAQLQEIKKIWLNEAATSTAESE